jgi:Vps5 C terminal like
MTLTQQQQQQQQQQFSAHVKAHPAASAASAAGDQIETTKRSALGKLLTKKNHSKEPDHIKLHRDLVAKLEESLKFLRTKLQDMIQKRKALSTAVSDFAKGFRQLSLVEKSYEPEGTLARTLMETSQKAESCSVCVLSLANRETIQVLETLQYYMGMIESIKRTLQQLESLRFDRDDATANVKLKRDALEKQLKTKTTVAAAGNVKQEQLKEQKDKQAEKDLFDAEDHDRHMQQLYARAEDTVKRDLVRFDMERRVDMCYMLSALVQLQISSSVDVQNVWKDMQIFYPEGGDDQLQLQQQDQQQQQQQDAAIDDSIDD